MDAPISQSAFCNGSPKYELHIPGYKIGKLIGTGAFAEVKEGIHLLTGLKVAIKILSKEAANTVYEKKNFYREAEIGKLVNSKHCCRLLETCETNVYLVLVFELVQTTLLTEIETCGKFNENKARSIIREVIAGIAHIHRLNVVHRDLKPENIGLAYHHTDTIKNNSETTQITNKKNSKRGVPRRKSKIFINPKTKTPAPSKDVHVQILDFGLAALLQTATDMLETKCGTLVYSAPELLGDKHYGAAVDVWSIGVVLYTMITGHLPYGSAQSLTTVHAQMLDHDYVLPDGCSDGLKDVFKKVFEVKPDKRITLQQLWQHPWIVGSKLASHTFSEDSQTFKFSTVVTASTLNDSILKHMTGVGFDPKEIRTSVLENRCDHRCSTYHIIAASLQHHAKLPVLNSSALAAAEAKNIGLQDKGHTHREMNGQKEQRRSLFRRLTSVQSNSGSAKQLDRAHETTKVQPPLPSKPKRGYHYYNPNSTKSQPAILHSDKTNSSSTRPRRFLPKKKTMVQLLTTEKQSSPSVVKPTQHANVRRAIQPSRHRKPSIFQWVRRGSRAQVFPAPLPALAQGIPQLRQRPT
eukprot:m.195616 g.195616  ORF g.195616 m.195616 type:complete len:579 (+) comp32575_c0_seq1:99-1835(+)